MPRKKIIRPKTRYEENKEKYKVPPTLEQIHKVMKLLKVSDTMLEKIWGMPNDTISKLRYLKRPIPVKYWHWIYIAFEATKKPVKQPPQ